MILKSLIKHQNYGQIKYTGYHVDSDVSIFGSWHLDVRIEGMQISDARGRRAIQENR